MWTSFNNEIPPRGAHIEVKFPSGRVEPVDVTKQALLQFMNSRGEECPSHWRIRALKENF